jgi:hypothetical protein
MPKAKRSNIENKEDTSLVTLNQMSVPNIKREMLHNAATFQRKLLSMFQDRRRDIDAECGYPTTEELDADKYKRLYDREPIAAKVVDIFPKYCWQNNPTLHETEDIDEETEFEKAWQEIGKQISGPGFFEDPDGGNPIWEFLQRADKLSGIGFYGGLLLGVDDGLDLSEPVEFRKGGDTKATRKLLYLRPLDETVCEISTLINDQENPRHGLPESYNVTFKHDSNGSLGQLHENVNTQKVHWSRIIHYADNLCSSEIHGVPRMQVVYNRLYDLYKLYGGSAEMYWLGAFFGLSFETHPTLGGDVKFDKEDMRKQLENYQHGLQRYLALPGMSAKTLAPSIVPPDKHVDVQIETVCVHIGCPKRIFLGSERGELASGQDARDWYGKVGHRQTSYVTPRVIVPFVDRLILMGILPVPERYYIKWPPIATITEVEQADIGLKNTQSMGAYVQGDVNALITTLDFLVRVLGWTKEEAEAAIQAKLDELARELGEGSGEDLGEQNLEEETGGEETKDPNSPKKEKQDDKTGEGETAK